MWFLQRNIDGKILYLLNKEYTIGRKSCTAVEIPEDLSVSRKHLKLDVDYTLFTQDCGQPLLRVMDLGSTYGVFVNPSASNPGKIEPQKWFSLEAGSSIHFGIKNEWSVKWQDITVLCSAVGSLGKKKLRDELVKLGAKQISDWENSVTHLVMEKIVFTQKVLDCLLACKPIVTVEFFGSWIQSLEENPELSMPNFAQFLPLVDKETLGQFDKQLFLPDEKRKSLFAGKTFIFPAGGHLNSTMAVAVRKAGGRAMEDPGTSNVKDIIFIEDSSSRKSDDYQHKQLNTLTSLGQRVIPQKEITLAILACSMEIYCNTQIKRFEKRASQNVAADASCMLSFKSNPDTQAPTTSKIRMENHEEGTSIHTGPSKKARMETNSGALSSEGANDITVISDAAFVNPPKKRICVDGLVEGHLQAVGVSSITNPNPNIDEWEPKRKKSVTLGYTSVKSPARDSTTNRGEVKSNETVSNGNLRRRSQLKSTQDLWHSHNKTSDFDTTSNKLAVKAKLVRSNLPNLNKSNAIRESSQQKDSAMHHRFREMKIATFRNGKWIMRS